MEKENEKHYASLLTFFKNLVWLVGISIAIIVSVAIYFTWADRSEMKKEISDLKLESLNIIEETKKSYQLQLADIQKSAEIAAINEAKVQVAETFRTSNIHSLIEKAAENEVGNVIRKKIEKEIDVALEKVNEEISILVKVADAGNRMRIGIKDGYFELLAYSNNGENKSIKNKASSLLEKIIVDYEKSYSKGFKPTKRTIPELVKIIKEESYLDNTTSAFLDLSAKTGINFRIFDFNAVEDWCQNNKDLCN